VHTPINEFEKEVHCQPSRRELRRSSTKGSQIAAANQQVADRIVRLRRDIPRSVDHRHQPAQVVIQVVRLVGATTPLKVCYG